MYVRRLRTKQYTFGHCTLHTLKPNTVYRVSFMLIPLCPKSWQSFHRLSIFSTGPPFSRLKWRRVAIFLSSALRASAFLSHNIMSHVWRFNSCLSTYATLKEAHVNHFYQCCCKSCDFISVFPSTFASTSCTVPDSSK